MISNFPQHQEDDHPSMAAISVIIRLHFSEYWIQYIASERLQPLQKVFTNLIAANFPMI